MTALALCGARGFLARTVARGLWVRVEVDIGNVQASRGNHSTMSDRAWSFFPAESNCKASLSN
jgi:hypothetical protein